jgi:hypothetical protein
MSRAEWNAHVAYVHNQLVQSAGGAKVPLSVAAKYASETWVKKPRKSTYVSKLGPATQAERARRRAEKAEKKNEVAMRRRAREEATAHIRSFMSPEAVEAEIAKLEHRRNVARDRRRRIKEGTHVVKKRSSPVIISGGAYKAPVMY